MKRLVFCLALSVLGSTLSAQTYSIQVGMQDYQNLNLATPLDLPLDWDDEVRTVGFGFSFPAGGLMHDSLILNTNGYLTTYDGNFEFNPYYVDLRGMGDETAITYVREGELGNRILKVEYFQAGFYDDTTGTARTSFQIWFFENGCWEVRTGPSVIVNQQVIFEGYPGPFIGFANYTAETVQALIGSVDQPFISQVDSIAFPCIDDVPENGRVYTFCPEGQTTQWEPVPTHRFVLAPNPAHQRLFVRNAAPNECFTLHTCEGRKLKTWKHDAATPVELDAFSPGLYWVRSNTGAVSRLVLE